MAKKILLLANNDTLDVQAVLLVKSLVDTEDIKISVEKTKKDNSNWQISDIVDGISAEFEELDFDVLYI